MRGSTLVSRVTVLAGGGGGHGGSGYASCRLEAEGERLVDVGGIGIGYDLPTYQDLDETFSFEDRFQHRITV